MQKSTGQPSELLPVLEQIEREKGIAKEEILHLIEQALVSAFRKHTGRNQRVEASINRDTGELSAWIIKTVVEHPNNPQNEITMAEAKALGLEGTAPAADVRVPIKTDDFGRIASQTAKQVIIQRMRETERERIFGEFKGREGQLLNGVVSRVIDRTIIVDLDHAEALLPVRDQIPGQRYHPGDRIRVLLLNVSKTSKGPRLIVSRTHPDLIRRLFEQEIPEVGERVVEIKQIVREPGSRAKVAVLSHNLKVDPVGACVGVKGSRVRPIIAELGGERIDLITYSDDPARYIANALSPAKTLNVTLNNEAKSSEVSVGDDMLSLTIGKAGQNVRMAARLTGWHIDIKSESQRREAVEAKTSATRDVLTALPGVGPKLAENLSLAGYASLERIAAASVENLTGIQGVGQKTAEKLIAAAREGLKADEKPDEETKDHGRENKNGE